MTPKDIAALADTVAQELLQWLRTRLGNKRFAEMAATITGQAAIYALAQEAYITRDNRVIAEFCQAFEHDALHYADAFRAHFDTRAKGHEPNESRMPRM